MAGTYVYMMSNRPFGVLYMGVTSDLVRRVAEHREGLIEGFTARYRLKELVWFEQHQTILNAIQREKNIKDWPRQWKLELVAAANPEWADLFRTIL